MIRAFMCSCAFALPLASACISLPAELEPDQAEALFAGEAVLVSSAKTCIKALNNHVTQARDSHFLRTVATSVSGGLAGTGGLIGALDDSAFGTVGSVVAMLGGVSSLITSNLLDPTEELGAHARGMQSFLAARRFYAEGDKARAEEALSNCWQDKETLAPEEKKAAVDTEDRRATTVICNGVYTITDDEDLRADEVAREPLFISMRIDAGRTVTLYQTRKCVGDEVVASLELTATWSGAGKAELHGMMRYAEGDDCVSPPERANTAIDRNLSAFIVPITQTLGDGNGSFQLAMTCNAAVAD
ncbi:MAG: hypothetical protein U1F43_06905 [Myxococcota bacterium]